MKFIALHDIPVLGIKEGRILELSDDELKDKSNKILLTSHFKEYLEPSEQIQPGDDVIISGWWKNLTHPGKNRKLYGLTNLTSTLARLDSIIYDSANNSVMIEAVSNGGIRYSATTRTTKKSEYASVKGVPVLPNFLGPSTLKKSVWIVYGGVYWFINSEGRLIKTIKGVNPARDAWLERIGNHYASKEAAKAAYNILKNNPVPVFPSMPVNGKNQ